LKSKSSGIIRTGGRVEDTLFLILILVNFLLFFLIWII